MKQLLEQYPHICAEIDDLNKSAVSALYEHHSHKMPESNAKDIDLLTELKNKKLEIEDFVRSLPNSEIRRIVKMRAFNGLSWNEIAAKMSSGGKMYLPASIKVKYHRQLKS